MRQWKEQLAANEEARLKKARANKKHAEEVRARARANREAHKNKNIKSGTALQRRNDADAQAARLKLQRYKKRLHQQQYNARYASVEEAVAMEKSTFRRLYGIAG